MSASWSVSGRLRVSRSSTVTWTSSVFVCLISVGVLVQNRMLNFPWDFCSCVASTEIDYGFLIDHDEPYHLDSGPCFSSLSTSALFCLVRRAWNLNAATTLGVILVCLWSFVTRKNPR